MSMSIYQDIILDHYRNPRNSGQLIDPSEEIEVSNPLCGDIISMQVKIEGDAIADVAYKADGCAISIASASLLSEYIKGKTKEHVQNLDRDFILELLGIELSPNRVKCATLPLEAVSKLITN